MKTLEPEKKTAVITGSSVGLGAHIASSLIHSGFNVVINYSKRKAEAEALGKKLSQIGNVKVLRGNVSRFLDARRVVEQTIREFGRIDVLINNAGIHIDGIVSKMSPESWKSVIDTNLTGVFNFSKAVIPHMQKQEFGRIINISSFTAFRGIAGTANYSASKAGIIGFTKSLAKEVAKYNITVNAIAPGYFDIGMFNDFNEETKNMIKKSIPTKRLGQPEEITELIQILISSSYLTGQVFILDGGFSI